MPKKSASSRRKRQENSIQCGRFFLNVETRQLSKDGHLVRLTPKEFQLLATFMRNEGRTLTRKTLMKEVWDTDYLEDTRTLDVHIHWVRKKIEDNPREPVYITTVRRVGYRFATEETPSPGM